MKNKTVCIITAAFLCVFSLLAYFTPKNEYSTWERRYLKKFPELSVESVADGRFMEDFEEYATDHFSFRNGFRRIRALFDRYIFVKSDTNGLYGRNGYISKLEYPLKTESLANALSRFDAICEKYLTEDNRIYFSVIPDKNYFMAGEEHLSIDYGEMIGYLTEKFRRASYIDIFSLLDIEDYYKTDTHWRQEKLVDVAEKICNSMGAEFTGDFEEKVLEKDFFGVYYGQSALPLEPDEIRYLTSPVIEECSVFDYEHNREVEIYDMEKAEGNDPYEMFLSGPISLIEINNPLAKAEKELIIFRDSFGSSIAPLMAEGYSKITLVDIRYISSAYLGQLMDFEDADVLFLYSTLVLNNSETFK